MAYPAQVVLDQHGEEDLVLHDQHAQATSWCMSGSLFDARHRQLHILNDSWFFEARRRATSRFVRHGPQDHLRSKSSRAEFARRRGRNLVQLKVKVAVVAIPVGRLSDADDPAVAHERPWVAAFAASW